MRNGIVTFAGAGPGAPDLLTLRCRDAIAEADVIVYAGSLINKEVLKFVPVDCLIYDSSSMTLPDTTKIMLDACGKGKKVLRLHTGDPSVYGAIAEQINELTQAGVKYDVIPGVSSVFAAAAALGVELTVPGVSQTVIFGRRAGRTPVPEGQEIESLAAHRATMALYLSAADMEGVVSDLLRGGYPEETAVAVVYRASWPDERIVRGTLADIADGVKNAGIDRQAVVIVGDALTGQGESSRLYSREFSHGFRSAEDGSSSRGRAGIEICGEDVFAGTVAVYGLTEAGCRLANRIGNEIGGRVFVSVKHCSCSIHRANVGLMNEATTTARGPDETGTTTPGGEEEYEVFDPEDLGDLIADNWGRFDGHVFVMAAGIVVRKIAPLMKGKTEDPAVVVCDETGQYAISLLSGHIGGANRLAYQVAGVTGGRAAITTATDAQQVVAFDDLAVRHGWEVVNPEAVKGLNSLLLQRAPIGMACPEHIVEVTYGARDHITHVSRPDDLTNRYKGLVVVDDDGGYDGVTIPVLRLRSRRVVLGIGCNRGVSCEGISGSVDSVLSEAGIDSDLVSGLATIDLKRDESGLISFARKRGWEISFFSAEQLKNEQVPNPSVTVEKAAGTPSVAEAAALCLGKGKLIVAKQKHGGVTVAVGTVESGR